MKHSNRFYILTAVALVAVAFGVSWSSPTFTDVNTTKYWGKTSLKDLTEVLDANFAMLETGATLNPAVVSNADMIVYGSNATFLGTAAITGVATFTAQSVHTGGVDLNGASTATNITMDTGSTLAAKALTVATSCDINSAMTTTNITLDAGATLAGTTSLTLGAGTETVSINSSDWDISTVGNVTGIGTFTADGDVDLTATGGSTSDGDFTVAGYAKLSGTVELDGALQADSTADFNGAITATNITMDAGSTAALVGITVTESADFNTAITCSNITADAGSTIAAQALTATSFLLNGEAGVYAADGTALMVQTTNVTMHAGTVWTQTWSTVFGATPTTVIITPTELHAAVPFYTAATPSNLLVTVEADKNFTLTCIGAKP